MRPPEISLYYQPAIRGSENMLRGNHEYTVHNYDEDYFSEIHDHYERGNNQKKLELISEFCGNVKGLSVLDAGCGSGVITYHLLMSGANVISMDFSRNALGKAEELFNTRRLNPCLAQGNVETLPFREDCFDLIVAADVIEHLYHRDKFLQEAYRTLKEGGKLVLTTDNAWYQLFAGLWAKMRAIANEIRCLNMRKAYWSLFAKITYFDLLDDSRHIQICSPKELKSELKEYGFVCGKMDTYFPNNSSRERVFRILALDQWPFRLLFRLCRQYIVVSVKKYVFN
jgi:ubiquinone/menaquinone biosynthesis C-methylase UbiE